MVVADGMGGAVGGKLASKLAVEGIERFQSEHPLRDLQADSIGEWLKAAVSYANRSIWDRAEADRSVLGMGSTIVVTVQFDSRLQIANVGDSRAYLFRDGRIKQLTEDHSEVADMILRGELTPEEARISPYKNLINRCLGHEEQVEINQTTWKLQSDDWIILCSDGLPTVLRDEQIGDVLESSDTPQRACEELVNHTLSGGAPDNVTVIAIRYAESIA